MSARRVYCHVYNKGVEKREIFNDSSDCNVFLSYLQDYLSPPASPESIKRNFIIKGRTFKGTPHQPKNYYNKIELHAYSLMPDHFHLVLSENAKGSLTAFIRSLCTRYSIYFNKKYKHTGSLFEGPYKLAHIKSENQLSPLINFIHHDGNDYSSYLEYSGKRETQWLSKKDVLSGQKGKITKEIAIESSSLERSSVASQADIKKSGTNSTLKPLSRIPEVAASFAVFLVLLGFGVRNISLTSAKSIAESTSDEPSVLSETTQATPSPKPKIMLMVKNSVGTEGIPIYLEPDKESEVISEAKGGETFEFVSISSGWFGVKLADGRTGFIHSDYIDILE